MELLRYIGLGFRFAQTSKSHHHCIASGRRLHFLSPCVWILWISRSEILQSSAFLVLQTLDAIQYFKHLAVLENPVLSIHCPLILSRRAHTNPRQCHRRWAFAIPRSNYTQFVTLLVYSLFLRTWPSASPDQSLQIARTWQPPIATTHRRCCSRFCNVQIGVARHEQPQVQRWAEKLSSAVMSMHGGAPVHIRRRPVWHKPARHHSLLKWRFFVTWSHTVS